VVVSAVIENRVEGNMTAGKKRKQQELSLMVSTRRQGRRCHFKAA